MARPKKRKKSNSASANVERSTPVFANVGRSTPRPVGGSLQNVIFSGMVALGCWGMTAFFAFFYFADANHFLYAAMAGLTAVGWTVLAVRRGLQLRLLRM